jgi:hypothetical protein
LFSEDSIPQEYTKVEYISSDISVDITDSQFQRATPAFTWYNKRAMYTAFYSASSQVEFTVSKLRFVADEYDHSWKVFAENDSGDSEQISKVSYD